MKIHSLMITASILATNGVSAFFFNSNPPAPQGSYYSNAPQDNINFQMHPMQAMGLDHRMLQDIEHAIDNSKKPERFKDVHINAFRGVVTINGTVASESDAKELRDYIGHTVGLRAIHDHLQIGAPKEADKNKANISYADPQTVKAPDSEITNSIHSILQEGQNPKKFSQVAFEVDSGVVRLHGTVDNNADKNEISQKIMRIPGVVSVEDQLTVK